MESLVLTLHILACLILIVLVLLQSGKEGMGVIFGGGSSTVFGSTGAGGLLTKLTAFLAGLFLVTSLLYNVLISSKPAGDSIMMDVPAVTQPADDIQTQEQAAPAPAANTDDIPTTAGEKTAE
ncbi:preprotein translocase subunit SecG [Desulfobaculum xiamenense]|uniref:Protein-export membrane protein SecG n=1 Tax=Desulfobaculum xiamenense TaxID=995050 RepID=A0A846QN02_9BACT|nr:preprotein translocase subunit SecG [Desulfobaculum xiamenense]NJB66795.1 preprotein translocase subunit SecG [Desulfobaculum xiamenense]